MTGIIIDTFTPGASAAVDWAALPLNILLDAVKAGDERAMVELRARGGIDGGGTPRARPHLAVEAKRAGHFEESQHPRDKHGRFISIGAHIDLGGGKKGEVTHVGEGSVTVKQDNGTSVTVKGDAIKNATVTKGPADGARAAAEAHAPDHAPAADTPTPPHSAASAPDAPAPPAPDASSVSSAKDVTGDKELSARVLEAFFATASDRSQGDLGLAEIYKVQGFDAKPTVVPAGSIKPSPDSVVLYRGLGAAGDHTAADLAEDFRTGDRHYPGWGVYGSGTYTTENEATARSRAADDGLVTMSYPKDRVVPWDEVKARYDQWVLDKGGVMAVPAYSDMGRWAAATGIDAYEVRNKTSGETYTVILNRGLATVEAAPSAAAPAVAPNEGKRLGPAVAHTYAAAAPGRAQYRGSVAHAVDATYGDVDPHAVVKTTQALIDHVYSTQDEAVTGDAEASDESVVGGGGDSARP